MSGLKSFDAAVSKFISLCRNNSIKVKIVNGSESVYIKDMNLIIMDSKISLKDFIELNCILTSGLIMEKQT